MPKGFDYLSEEQSELNRSELKLTKINEKVLFEGEKFSSAKFNAEKIFAAKMSYGKKSGDELSSGETGLENILRRNLMWWKCHAVKFLAEKFPVAKFNAAVKF